MNSDTQLTPSVIVIADIVAVDGPPFSLFGVLVVSGASLSGIESLHHGAGTGAPASGVVAAVGVFSDLEGIPVAFHPEMTHVLVFKLLPTDVCGSVVVISLLNGDHVLIVGGLDTCDRSASMGGSEESNEREDCLHFVVVWLGL